MRFSVLKTDSITDKWNLEQHQSNCTSKWHLTFQISPLPKNKTHHAISYKVKQIEKYYHNRHKGWVNWPGRFPVLSLNPTHVIPTVYSSLLMLEPLRAEIYHPGQNLEKLLRIGAL